MTIIDVYREYGKWLGLAFLIIESILLGGNIFGFSALFDILPRYGIYSNLCTNRSPEPISNVTNETTFENCDARTEQYKLALTIGIWFYNLMPFFLGLSINYLGCRFVKLVSIIFHIAGWLSLTFIAPGRDYLLFLHTIFTSISSSVVLITGFAYCRYFGDGTRAVVSSIISGSSISSTMWFSIFQVLITDNQTTLKILSIIWTVFVIIMIITACFFMDWKFPFLHLPYEFAPSSNTNNNLTESADNNQRSNVNEMVWYQRIVNRVGVWEHLLSPVYILVVLYLSFLLLPSVFLPVTWFPWVMHITKDNEPLSNKYTLIFNLCTTAALVICPSSGFLLDFRARNNSKQRIFNIALMQTITWFMAVAVCIVRMFYTKGCIIAAIVLNCIERSLIAGGCQAVVASFFPTEYLGTLTGVLWTTAAIFSSIQYGLLPLTEAVEKSWRAWAIILGLVVIMAIHWIHMWYLFFTSRSNAVAHKEEIPLEERQANGSVTHHTYDNETTEEDSTRI
ncbi:unnamed protein product [Rotaria sordida]|uniref:Uncharacterized protein n=1 Tax=Rotaria sordida TaxID=392033 RepID=A0A819AZ25_9BILA|nr:unnamed protein product [Rotaria sordida]CAF3795087.1 unnamed protein product [Rotaria sordida]